MSFVRYIWAAVLGATLTYNAIHGEWFWVVAFVVIIIVNAVAAQIEEAKQ